MAKKTYDFNLNGATSGACYLPGFGGPTFNWDDDAATLESLLNSVSGGGFPGWTATANGSGRFTIEQPEEAGDYEWSVVKGSLDTVPTVTVTQAWTPSVNLSVDDNTISEPSGEAIVTFGIAAAHSQSITVEFALSGTATEGDDYTLSTSSPVVIDVGSSTASMSITATDDATFEPAETIIVSLGSITNGESGTSSELTITLTSDDSAASSGMLQLMGVG